MGYGTRIKALLKEKKISIKEVSKQTGISLNTLYSITKRDSDKVDIGILIKIASFLEIDITELVDSDSMHHIDYLDAINEYDYKQNMLKMNFSNNLNYLIGHYKINLSDLAHALDVHIDNLTKWISGDVLPNQNERKLLEQYFKLEDNSMTEKVILGIFSEKPENETVINAVNNSLSSVHANGKIPSIYFDEKIDDNPLNRALNKLDNGDKDLSEEEIKSIVSFFKHFSDRFK